MARQENRAKPGELVYGINPVRELLKAGRRKVTQCYTTSPFPREWKSIQSYIERRNVRVHRVDRAELVRMIGSTEHQGVVAMTTPFTFKKDPFEAKQHPYIMLLDGIQDPRNLGAILRSAYCACVDGVLLTRKGSAPISSVVLKSSAGLAEHITIRQVPSAAAALQEIKQGGYQLYVATFGGKSPEEYELSEPLCLAMGSEGAGVSSLVARAGKHLTLAQRSADISYNVSVAAGILLFSIGRKNGRI